MKNINVINQRMSLENAVFEKLQRATGPVKTVLKDEILNFKFEGNKISFSYKRTLKADPECIYRVYIIFSYESEISKESLEELEKENQLNEKYLKDSAHKIVENTPMCSVASNIISNLTAINGNRPFISPPVFIK